MRQQKHGRAAAECFHEALAAESEGPARARALFGIARCAVEHIAEADPFTLRSETLRALLWLLSDVRSQLAHAVGTGTPVPRDAAAAASRAEPSALQLVALLRDATTPLLRGGHFRFALEHLGYAVRALEVMGLAQDPGHLACYLDILEQLAGAALGTPAAEGVVVLLESARGAVDHIVRCWEHSDVPLLTAEVRLAQAAVVKLEELQAQMGLCIGLGGASAPLDTSPQSVKIVLAALRSPVRSMLKRKAPNDREQNILEYLGKHAAGCKLPIEARLRIMRIAFRFENWELLKLVNHQTSEGTLEEAGDEDGEGGRGEGGKSAAEGAQASDGDAVAGPGPDRGVPPLEYSYLLLQSCRKAQDDTNIESMSDLAQSLATAMPYISKTLATAAALELYQMVHPLLHKLPQAAPQEILNGRRGEIAAILQTLHAVFHEVGLDDSFLRLQVVINLGLLWDRMHTKEETAAVTKCIWEALHAFNESQKALYQHIPPWMSSPEQNSAAHTGHSHEDEKRPRVYALLQCLYADALSLLYKIHICATLRSFNLLDAAADSSLSAEDALAQQAVWKKAVSKLRALCGKNSLYHALMLCQLSYYDSEHAIHHLKEAVHQVEAAEKGCLRDEGQVKVVCTTKSTVTFCADLDAIRRKQPLADRYAVHVKPSETSPSNMDDTFPGAGDVVGRGRNVTVSGFKENQKYFFCFSVYDSAGNLLDDSPSAVSAVTSVPVPSEMLWGYIALSAAHSQQYAILSVASKKVFYKFASSNLYSSVTYSAPSDGLQMKEDEAKYGPMPLIRLFTSIILTISYNVELNHSKMKAGSNKALMEQLQQKQTLLGIESSLYLNANAHISSIVEWVSELVHYNILHASRKHSTVRMLLTLYVTLTNTSTDSAGDALKQQIAWLAYQVQNEMGFSNEPDVAEWVKEILPQGDGPSEHSLGIEEIQKAMRGGAKSSSADKRAAGVLDSLFKSSSAEDVLKLFGEVADPWYHRSMELGVRAAERLVAKGGTVPQEQRRSILKAFDATSENLSKSEVASTSQFLEEIAAEPDDEAAQKALAGKWLLHHLKRQLHTEYVVKSFDHTSGWMARYLSTISALQEDTPPAQGGEEPAVDSEAGQEEATEDKKSSGVNPISRGTLLASAANYSLRAGDATEVMNTALNYWNSTKYPSGAKRSIPNSLAICHALREHLDVLQDSHQRSSCMRFFELVARDLVDANNFQALVHICTMLIERVSPKHLVSTLSLLGNLKDEDLGENLRRQRARVMDKLFLEDLLYLKLENCRTTWHEASLSSTGKRGIVARYRTLAKSLVSHGDIPLLAKCLNDFGDLYACQGRYGEAEKEWTRCVDAICGRKSSVMHWREILGDITIVDVFSPAIGLLICTVLGKLAKYCCLRDCHMRTEYSLMAAKILEQMLPHVTAKQMVSYDLPHLHTCSMVTKDVLHDLQDCPAPDLFSSLDVIISSLLENQYLSSAVPIAIIMEYVASTVLNDKMKVIHACMLKVTVLSRMGEMDRACVYLQDVISGGASEGSLHFHRGVRVGENLARTIAGPGSAAFNNREGLGNEQNKKIADTVAKLHIPGEYLYKDSQEVILLGQVEWLVKICESCLNSSAQLDPGASAPTTDAGGLESASKHLATALGIVEPIFQGSERSLSAGGAGAAAEEVSSADVETTSESGEGSTTRAPPGLAAVRNGLSAGWLVVAIHGLKGEMGEMFAATERFCKFLRNLDAACKGRKIDPEIVHLSAAAWLKSSTCIAMSYFVSGHHDFCRDVSMRTLRQAQCMRDMKTVHMCNSLLAQVDLLEGRIESASARVSSTLELGLAMKVSSPQFLCMLIGVGDAQAQLGNIPEAHATWRAAESILRTHDTDAPAGASVCDSIANPEVSTFYAPSRFVSVLVLLRAAMAEISSGHRDAGAHKIREALGVLKNSVNSSPRLWTAAWTLLALATKPEGQEANPDALDAFRVNVQNALSWAKYDAQIPALNFLAVEYASAASLASTGSSAGPISHSAMATFQKASSLSSESKNFHYSSKNGSMKDIVEAASAGLASSVPPTEATVKSVSTVTEADPKIRSLEWAVNGLQLNQYQNSLFSHSATWSCNEFQTVPPETKPYDVDSLQALLTENLEATTPGTIACQWRRACTDTVDPGTAVAAHTHLMLLGGVCMQGADGPQMVRLEAKVPSERILEAKRLVRGVQVDHADGISEVTARSVLEKAMALVLNQEISGKAIGIEGGDGSEGTISEEEPELDLLLKFLHNLLILDLGVNVVNLKLARWLGALVSA